MGIIKRFLVRAFRHRHKWQAEYASSGQPAIRHVCKRCGAIRPGDARTEMEHLAHVLVNLDERIAKSFPPRNEAKRPKVKEDGW